MSLLGGIDPASGIIVVAALAVGCDEAAEGGHEGCSGEEVEVHGAGAGNYRLT